MRSLILLSFFSASILIFSYFSALGDKFLLTKPYFTKISAVPSDTASITVTAGDATTVDRETTLTVLSPVKETAITASGALTAFKHFW